MAHMYHALVAFVTISTCLCEQSIVPFGLTLTSRLSIEELHRFTFTGHDELFHSLSSSSDKNTDKKARIKLANQLCKEMRSQRVLSTKKQYKICRRDPGIPHVLVTAYKDMLQQCKIQFQHERWNCENQQSRARILNKDIKEKSFLEALTSAGLAVTFAKACELGHLSFCGCNPQSQSDLGCADTVRFGEQFARRFLNARDAPHKKSRSLKSLAVSIRNTKMGILLTSKLARKDCKCHGMSTSCTMKTCWSRTPPLSTVASALKVAYDQATPVQEIENNMNTWRIPAKKRRDLKLRKGLDGRNLKPLDMVYIDPSPDFCQPSSYGPGTSGRECSLANNTCGVICCGRGHTFTMVDVSIRCKCTTQWCCKVQCQLCEHRETRAICN